MLIHYYADDVQYGSAQGRQQAAERLLDYVLSRSVDSKDTVVILDMCWEGFEFAQWQHVMHDTLDVLRSNRPKSKLLMTINSHFQQYAKEIEAFPIDDVLYVDYFLYAICVETLKFKSASIKKKWDPTSNKLVCLGGRYKEQRAYFFERMFERGLLKDSQYFFSHKMEDRSNFDPGEKIRNIINQSTSQIDKNIAIYQDWFGSWYLFENCLFQIVVETSCLEKNDYPWITEKTWAAILNHNPFMTLGDAGTGQALSKMGFKIFDQYLPCNDYQNLDFESKCDAIIDNSKWWLNNIEKQQSNITEIVNHNFNVLIYHFTKNYLAIKNFMKKHNLGENFNHIVPTDYEDLNMCWRNYYENIRDPSWPPCQFFRDIPGLPNHIVRELMDFDYQFLEKFPPKKQQFEDLVQSKQALTLPTSTG